MICSFCNHNNSVAYDSHTVRTEQEGRTRMQRVAGYYCLECWIKLFEVTNEAANQLRSGDYLHTTNCDECRKKNKAYCGNCVD
jgi:hypothetical protein